jgi:GLPGLI family protein
MKKIILCAALSFTIAAKAQMKEGRVVYERVFQLPTRNLNIDPSVAAQIPKSRTDQFELLFSGNQSLWQYLPSLGGEDQGNFSGGGVVLRFAGATNEVTYSNFEKGVRVDQREIADKNYVVTDTVQKLAWKLTDESKTVLGHTVFKATAQRIGTRSRMTMENGEMKRQEFPDTAKVVAWFATDIPVSAGPDFGGQLPGLILELDVDNGQTVYRALEISPKVSVSKIKEPKDGKKMTAVEFRKERDKIMEEMRKNMPQGMNIRMQN